MKFFCAPKGDVVETGDRWSPEKATFSELWQKVRLEEAHLQDLESATYTNLAPRKHQMSTDDRRQGENPYPRNQP